MNRTVRILSHGAALLLAAMLAAGCSKSPEALVASAKEHLANNDRPAALIQLRNALQKNPDLAEARLLLGKTLYENGEYANAEKELRKAAELGASPEQVLPVLARTLVARGESKQVVTEFANAALTTPEAKADVLSSVGQALTMAGEADAARAAFAAANRSVPDYPSALVGEARLKASANDLDGALALLDKALAKDATLVEGWQLKGDIHSAQGRTAPALAAYRKALDTKPDYVPAHARIVTLLMTTDKAAEAKEQLAEMQKVAPKHPQTTFLQAWSAYQDKNYTAARDAIQLHLKFAPNSLPGMLLGAQIDYQLGSYVQAQSEVQAVLQQVPSHPLARRLLVQLYVRDGKPAKALETLKPMLDEGKPDSNLLALAGEVYMLNGDAAAAAQYFEQSAALDPKNASKRTAAAITHLAQGEDARGMGELEAIAAEDTGIRADLALIAANVRQKKYDAALAAVAALEKKQPDKPLPHNLRGAVLYAKGDAAGARKSFEKAVAVDPTFYPAVANLARLDVADGKPDDARKRFDALLAKDPANAQALLAIAELRARDSAPSEEVAGLINKAIAAKPTEVAPRLALVTHYLQARDPKRAVGAAQDAVAALPNRPELLNAAARAYQAAGDTNQAITTYKTFAQVRPESPVPYVRMAELQASVNDKPAALDNLNKALALDPDFVEAKRALIALDVSSGRSKEALEAARDIQKKRPKEALGYLLEGNIHAQAKSWNEAATVYRAGLKASESPELAVRLYVVLGAGGKQSEADTFAASWTAAHPQDRMMRLYLAQQAIRKNDYAAAASQYKSVLVIEPNDAMALNNLAWVSGQLKDPKAIEYAERANKISPNNAAILDTFGMLLVDKGDTKQGVEMMQRAMTAAPDAAPIRLNLARALLKDGQKDAARKELDTLAKLGDKFPAQAEVTRLMQSL